MSEGVEDREGKINFSWMAEIKRSGENTTAISSWEGMQTKLEKAAENQGCGVSNVPPVNVIKTINVITTIKVIKIDHTCKCNTNRKIICNNF